MCKKCVHNVLKMCKNVLKMCKNVNKNIAFVIFSLVLKASNSEIAWKLDIVFSDFFSPFQHSAKLLFDFQSNFSAAVSAEASISWLQKKVFRLLNSLMGINYSYQNIYIPVVPVRVCLIRSTDTNYVKKAYFCANLCMPLGWYLIHITY
jgi:hypothetical protein